MGEVKTLFQKNCECRYVPGMEATANYAEKIRNVTNDFLDRVLMGGEVVKTDFFYLRAVSFCRIATAEMVAEYLRYFRNYYGTVECSNLLQPKVATNAENMLVREEDYLKSIDEIRSRLNRLAKKYLLYAFNVVEKNPEEGYSGLIFCANYTTYSLVRTFFGETPCFGEATFGYERFYCITPIQKMMESMHACRVGILGFVNHKQNVQLVRENDIIFGSHKEHYRPAMVAEVRGMEYDYKIIIEPIHFAFDDQILTKTEHLQNIESMIATMGRLISHYNYMEKTFLERPVKERVRFLIAAENLDGIKKIVQLMNPQKEKFSGKVFFTTDLVLRDMDKLEDCVLMAKEVPSKVSGELHLGLVKPTRESILFTKNEWLFGTPK